MAVRPLLLAFVVLGCSRALRGQLASPSVTPATVQPGTTNRPNDQDSSYRGSVASGNPNPTPIELSLSDALDRGVRANLGLLTTNTFAEEARAQRVRALSSLLPRITGNISATEQQTNLQALGINFPSGAALGGLQFPVIVGPFGYQAAQANAQINLFDWTAINNFRSARENLKSAALSLRNARDVVVLTVGNGYLQIISDAARITSTQAQIDADNAVFQNAVRRHDAGTAIAIDVSRAEVELKRQQQTLISVKNQFEKDKLALARAIGLPPGQDFSVADPAPSIPLAAISLQDALVKAYENRADYQSAKLRVEAARLTASAARAERYPTLSASGYYADIGLHLFTMSHGVFQATGSVQFNIFDGGRIRSDITQSNAELRLRHSELENLRGQIDNDVRNALLDLTSSNAQIEVARSNLDLANQTLTQSRDRFAAGVTNTVEVVQAQQSVASANENLISAQYQNNIARVELARALGLAEAGVKTYFDKQRKP